MSSWSKVKEEVLVKSKRYCCFCLSYEGRDIEVHHIVPKAKGGEDAVDNVIPLCFKCHSEIGSYNPDHPKGNKYSANELKQIRDENYEKIEHLPRNPDTVSEDDKALLEEFKNDYTDILEYCIRTDFTAEFVDPNLGDRIFDLYYEKWTSKRLNFNSNHLREIKSEILETLNDLQKYLSPDYLRVHETSGNLIFRNQSEEEGNKLRDDFRPNSERIRIELRDLLNRLYDL